MSGLTQSLAVVQLNVVGLVSRPGSALVVILGVACVVGVMLSVLSVTAGLSRASRSGVDARNAIVLATEAPSEDGSSLSQDTCSILVQAPGIARGPDGKAIVDCEVVRALPLDGFAFGMLYVRGVGDHAWPLYPGFKMVSGRLFRPGIHELIVGVGALAIFHLNVGDTIALPDGQWSIVGSFTSGGGVLESQLLADAATVTASTRASGFNSVLVRLESPASFDAFAHWVNGNPALTSNAERQAEFYLRSVSPFMKFFSSLAFFIAAVLAVGALFGSLNVLFGRVRARTREIVTLRILGFGAAPIAISVLSEAVLLSLLGAAVGVASAWLLFSGAHSVVVHTTFQLSLTPHLVVIGFAWAVTIGLVGSLLPAIRAIRLPITQGMRDTATI